VCRDLDPLLGHYPCPVTVGTGRSRLPTRPASSGTLKQKSIAEYSPPAGPAWKA